MTIEKLDISLLTDSLDTKTLIPDNQDTTFINSCNGSHSAFLICDKFDKADCSFLVILPTAKETETFFRECTTLLGDNAAQLFPSRDSVPYNMKSPFGPTTEARLKTLSMLMDGEKKLYITTASALIQKIPPKQTLFNKIIHLAQNDDVDISQLGEWLVELGFSRESMVSDPGTFAVRGGIMDIYPFMSENPVRLEFFGNTIESIREFDIFRQRSIKQLSKFDVFPMREFIIDDDMLLDGIEKIEKYILENEDNEGDFSKLKHNWETTGDLDGIEWFHHWFNLKSNSILDYLPQDCTIIWNDAKSPFDRFDDQKNNYTRHLDRVPPAYRPFVSEPNNLLLSNSSIVDDMQLFRQIFINTHIDPNKFLEKNEIVVDIGSIDQPSFNGHFQLFTDELIKKQATGFFTAVVCESKGHAERLSEQLGKYSDDLEILYGFIKNGFIDPKRKIAIYWENSVFNRVTKSIRRSKSRKSSPITSYDAVVPGDFVVHIDHGVSKFIGIERIKTGISSQDCMVLEFQNRSKVYVPIEDFSKVQKYIGKDSTAPILSKLGTARWQKLKEKTRESLAEMAQELIELYAKRDSLRGISFQGDSVWQGEFEDSFIYDPTKDQLSAIADIKKDMESSKPMDRLVCGDVGFGKTEVAMRACFKAAVDGYQVALLAPTTILANQHFNSFKERMADFPISISVLSRFQKPAEQKNILKRIKSGNVNILIGTHRILSKDVEFNNLGLLVIDEEQRFGVKHKERLKEYRYKVDVLSMSATPIPRTMHMSLAGIRDLSIINTPPSNRLPVETSVSEYHDEIVLNAIENETERGGQIFIVHNRINNLYVMQENYEKLLPNTRFVVAHGQMDEGQLEVIMKEFIAGKHDVLLSTTIIENGLDITNVNTIIVNRADTLGLSQLYQLRGRVGRSSEQAYAYFLTPSFKKIPDISLKRLKALEQYTDLGSGFQIAMRDMEIRGAGNLLGTKQHGFIAAVGFELYTQLLKEEVDKLRNSESPEKDELNTELSLSLNSFIPADYIADDAIRISLYQECSASTTLPEVTEMEKGFIDRFGPLPESVEALLISMRIRIIANSLNISKISTDKESQLFLSFFGDENEIGDSMRKLIPFIQNPFEITGTDPVRLKILLAGINVTSRAIEIKTILSHALNQTNNNRYAN